MKLQSTQKGQNSIKKKEQIWELTLLDFKTYCKDIVIKIM